MDQNSSELENGSYKGVSHEEPGAPSEAEAPDRRAFLKKTAAVAAGGAVVAAPMGAGLAVLLDPLRKAGGAAQFHPVARLDALPENGAPVRFAVVADSDDAWNHHPQTRIGAVYLKRSKAPDGSDKVLALSTICPHLGCSVDAQADGSFRCPCHNSTFNPDGSLGHPNVSARPMDSLETQVRDGLILVKYQKFETSTPQKIPRG